MVSGVAVSSAGRPVFCRLQVTKSAPGSLQHSSAAPLKMWCWGLKGTNTILTLSLLLVMSELTLSV